MKKQLTLLSLLFIVAGSAQSLNWGNEITVADGNVYGFIRPRIAVTTGNIPVIMWGGGTTTQPLYAARFSGTSFNTPVTITPTSVDPFIDTWAGADIAGRGNTLYAVFKRQPEMSNGMFIVKSTDGGVTWSDTTRIQQSIYNRFPSVAITPSGDPAVIFMTFDSAWGTPGYSVTNSTNGGMTFPVGSNVSLLGGAEVCDCCPGYIEISGNTQAATWRRNQNNRRDMWAAISTNGGTSFPTGLDVDNTDWMLSACPSTGPDPYLMNDTLYTVFMSGASGDERIMINSHNILTGQDGFTAMLDPGVPSSDLQNYPFIAGSGDTMVVVWQDLSSGNTDVWCTWSVNGAQDLFVNKTLVNSSTSGQQRNIHVAYSNATFHFTWTDAATADVIYRSATIMPNGISEISAMNQLRIFPNPATSGARLDLTFMNGNPGKVIVKDISGKSISTQTVSGEKEILLPQYGAGVYFIEVTVNGSNAAVYTGKLINY